MAEATVSPGQRLWTWKSTSMWAIIDSGVLRSTEEGTFDDVDPSVALGMNVEATDAWPDEGVVGRRGWYY